MAAKRDRLLAHKVVSRIKTTAAQQKACKVTLDNFARLTWPNHDMDLLHFPKKWQIRLAQNVARIQTVEHLRKKFKTVGCHLDFSNLSKCSDLLVHNIIVILESVPPSIIAPAASRPPTIAPAASRPRQERYVSNMMRLTGITPFKIQYKTTKHYTAL